MQTKLVTEDFISGQRATDLPAELIVKIAHCLVDIQGCVGPLRETSRHFAAALKLTDGLCLKPLGTTAFYSSFHRPVSVDFASRGQTQILKTEDLELLSDIASSLKTLNLSGAFQLTSLDPLQALTALEELNLAETTTLDDHLAVLQSFPNLKTLDLSGCLYLTATSLPHIITATGIHRLSLHGCGLSLHLHPEAVNVLTGLVGLRELDVGGCNGVDDVVLENILKVPNLRKINISGAVALTDIGLMSIKAAPSASTLSSLDLSNCRLLTASSWSTLASLPALQELSLCNLEHLLRYPGPLEAQAPALWKLPHLKVLKLSGSAVHPSNLKLLAATCGQELEHLDLSLPLPQHSMPGIAGRTSVRFAKDICEAARHFKQLRYLDVSGLRLTLTAALAFMRAAPKLTYLDLSGCQLEGLNNRNPRARVRLNFSERRGAVVVQSSGNSAYIPHDVATVIAAAARDEESRSAPPEPEASVAEFAAALGALPFLKVLKLNSCQGLKAEHFKHVSKLGQLEELSVAFNKGLEELGLIEVLKKLPCSLKTLNVRHCSVGDALLCALASATSSSGGSKSVGAVKELETLALAGAGSSITHKGLAALASTGAARTLHTLELEDCSGVDDEVASVVGSHFVNVKRLSLVGSRALTATGVESLASLNKLQHLNLKRCASGVTDDSLANLCSGSTRLTSLNIAESFLVTSEGLQVLQNLKFLAALDLTCCGNMGKEDGVIENGLKGVTNANVQLPYGKVGSVTGSPIKRRPQIL